jgi:hypothetical protein
MGFGLRMDASVEVLVLYCGVCTAAWRVAKDRYAAQRPLCCFCLLACLALRLSTSSAVSPRCSAPSKHPTGGESRSLRTAGATAGCLFKQVRTVRAVQSSPFPFFAIRRQAPRWARGWVGDPRARSRAPPTSAPFAKKVGSKTRSCFAPNPRVLQTAG